MISSTRRLLFRLVTRLPAIAALAGGADSGGTEPGGPQSRGAEAGALQADRPVEVFKPTKALAFSRLILWLATDDCVLHLFLDLPERPTNSSTVSATGVVTTGTNPSKYKVPQGGAPNPP